MNLILCSICKMSFLYERADDYSKWLEVGLCLFNIDNRLFES